MAMVRRLLGGALRAYLFLVLFMFASGVLAGAWIAFSAKDSLAAGATVHQ